MILDQTLVRDNTLTQRQNRDLLEPHLRMESSEPAINFDVINERKESPRVHVPITLCLLILTSYICGGGALFSIWEGWNYLDGSYFCFVTLSKISFFLKLILLQEFIIIHVPIQAQLVLET